MKLKSFMIMVMLLSPMVFSLPFGVAEDEVVWEIGTLNDMIDFVTSIEVHMNQSAGGEESSTIFSYKLIGEETVESIPCNILNFTIGEPEELEEYTLWFSKSSGEAVQVFFEGEIQTGFMANITGSMVLLVFNVINTMWAAYSYETIEVWETSAYGSITPLGTETRQVGPTFLTISGTRYIGNDPTGQSQVTIDAWFAPTQKGHIMIEIAVESVSGGETVLSGMEVVSIELTEDQVVPETPDDTTGDDTSGDDTSGDDTSGDDTSGDDTTGEDSNGEDNQSGGGIPGFQYEAIIVGLAVAAILLYNMRKH